jgi:hypothetical protein
MYGFTRRDIEFIYGVPPYMYEKSWERIVKVDNSYILLKFNTAVYEELG